MANKQADKKTVGGLIFQQQIHKDRDTKPKATNFKFDSQEKQQKKFQSRME